MHKRALVWYSHICWPTNIPFCMMFQIPFNQNSCLFALPNAPIGPEVVIPLDLTVRPDQTEPDKWIEVEDAEMYENLPRKPVRILKTSSHNLSQLYKYLLLLHSFILGAVLFAYTPICSLEAALRMAFAICGIPSSI